MKSEWAEDERAENRIEIEQKMSTSDDSEFRPDAAIFTRKSFLLHFIYMQMLCL